ncbi:MAG: hypothetical protein J5824_09565 [Lachnospiraceae bacterium]|nr:hypothetical protein [Lachnospiraceae bacterium]
MDSLMFEEMCKNAKDILIYVKEKGAESDEIKKKKEFIKEAKSIALEISELANDQGLLELKQIADKLAPDKAEGHLKELLYLIIDGVDPDIIYDIARNMYFMNCYSGFGGLEFTIYMYTCLAVQQGEPTRIIESVIDSMIPDVLKN